MKTAYEIFIEQSHKDYAKKMLGTSNRGNVDQVFRGFHSVPTPSNDGNGLKIKMWNLNGTIATPWFGGDYAEEYYQEDRKFIVMLELPKDIKDQIGSSGSLVIDLEVATREETGWVEEVTVFTLHTTQMNWSEAESVCQREGGHLASVTSEEENQLVKDVADDLDHSVWLGGNKVLGEWTWSDNSTWSYDKRHSDYGGDCVYFGWSGYWHQSSCGDIFYFICQKTNILKGKTAESVTYSRDQLNFSNFIVHYKFKAASQQLLDSWKEKRMTGFRLSWKINNPPLIANISEVGRSIQTPGYKDSALAPLEGIYKAILIPPKDLSKELINQTLVIELDVNMKPSDEVYAFTSYKVYREYKSWTEAELHCKSESGQLASIHSNWEQTLAEKAIEKETNHIWLGGRMLDGRWQWTDNTSWKFTNWDSGSPQDIGYLMMTSDRKWVDSWNSARFYVLCQGTTVPLTEKGLTTIELKKEQLTFLPFHLLFQSKAINYETSNTSQDEGRRISGFTLNWFLKEINGTKITEELPARQEDWRQEVPLPQYKELFFDDMVQLARELRLKNMTKEEILQQVIHQKSQIGVIPEVDEMCSSGQVKSSARSKVFSKLMFNASTSQTSGDHSHEDIETGYELFHAVVFCPSMVFKLYTFIDQLLSNETSRTIIHTIVNLFQSGAITDETSFGLAKQFYQVLASTLDMQYGNILLATATNAQRENIINKGLPFFLNNTESVKKCLRESHCATLQDIFQGIGILSFISLANLPLSSKLGDHISRELSLHPIHLTHDQEGNVPPSALVPFCFYQGESGLLGRKLPELNNMTVCDKFQPTLLEGQLCYSLNMAKLRENPELLAKSGKQNGLLLLLDPKPYHLIHSNKSTESSDMDEQHFKVLIHALHTHTIFGPGSSAMSTLKKMTSTESFKQLSDYQKKCHVHNREECQAQKYLDRVQKYCKCIPWALQTGQVMKKFLNVLLFDRRSPSVVPRKRPVLQTRP